MKATAFVAATLLHASAAVAEWAAAQCSPLISYVPVTYTVTETVTPVPASVVEQSVASSAIPAPVTSVSTHFVTVTVSPAGTSSVAHSGSTPVYSYVEESGSISWFNSITPSYGQSLLTITSTVYVYPGSSQSAITDAPTLTVSPPPYETTSYSEPDDDDVTVTVTATRTTTITLSTVVTNTRSSFTPIGSSGWNSSTESSTTPSGDEGVSTLTGVPTTLTGTVYLGTGSHITSTSYFTSTLTVTLSRHKTITITPPGSTLTITTIITPTSPAVLSDAMSSSIGSDVSAQSSNIVPASYSQGSVVSETSVSPTAALSTSSIYVSTQSSLSTDLYSSQTAPSTGSGIGSRSTRSASSITSSIVIPSSLVASSSRVASSSEETISPVTGSSSASTFAPVSPSSGLISTASSSTVQTSASISSLRSTLSTSSATAPISLPGYGAPSLASSSETAILPHTGTSSVVSSSTLSPSSLVTSFVSSRRSSSETSIPASLVTSVPISAITDFFPSTYSSRPISQSMVSEASSVSSQAPSLPAGYGEPSTLSTQTSSSTIVASPTPSVCGEHGNFTLNFDDLPSFSTNNNNTDITQAPPIFNGYHHLAFSDGYVYAPPPRDPFPPVSPPHLAVFLGNASGSAVNNTPTAMAPISGMIRPGEFGDGISDSVSAFWFNAYSVFLGCDNSGPEVCTYVLTAYAWNPTVQQELQVDTTNVTTSPCPGFQNCRLEQVTFPSTFNGLSGLQIQAYKGPDQVMFFMDDVSMGWYNNTCAAGLQRLRSQRGGTPAKR